MKPHRAVCRSVLLATVVAVGLAVVSCEPDGQTGPVTPPQFTETDDCDFDSRMWREDTDCGYDNSQLADIWYESWQADVMIDTAFGVAADTITGYEYEGWPISTTWTSDYVEPGTGPSYTGPEVIGVTPSGPFGFFVMGMICTGAVTAAVGAHGQTQEALQKLEQVRNDPNATQAEKDQAARDARNAAAVSMGTALAAAASCGAMLIIPL